MYIFKLRLVQSNTSYFLKNTFVIEFQKKFVF